MSLIGDCIISAREIIPDLPPTLPAPTISNLIPGLVPGGILAGTYFIVVTQLNPWGESLGSAEATVIISGTNNSFSLSVQSNYGATALRVYIGTTAGNENFYYQLNLSILGTFFFVQVSTNLLPSGYPPSRSTAFLPDADGQYLSAGTLYRWLNQGLSRLARKAGGLQDYTGVGTVAGQPLYQVVGGWSKFTAAWYDGFPLGFGNQRDFFRRNTITSSVLSQVGVSIRDNRVIIEVYYQPVRTSGSSTLASAMASTDTTASLVSSGGFQSFGPPMMAQIGSEIVALSAISGSNLNGLTRGIGGTTPQAWPIGTVVKELNLWLLGKRNFSAQYVPGNSANLLPVPEGWETILPDYILNRSRRAEQQDQEGAQYLKEFDAAIMDFLRANRQMAGPTQAGGSSGGAETVAGFGIPGLGGVVLP